MTIRTCLSVALAGTAMLASMAAAQIPDHLQCYKVKDTSLVLKGTVDLDSTLFGVSTGCKISSAKLYCVASQKQNPNVFNITTPLTPLAYSAAVPSEDRLCYKVSCKSPEVPYPNQTVTDQFHTHTLTKLKTGMLCTPANQGASYCGDGTIDAGEDCDGVDLGGATCVTRGFGSGALACAPGCHFDTSACIAAAFPASGQTQCWNAAGASVSCAGTGQDGALQAGSALAYVDNGDGTVTDLNTGLMWEQKSDDGTIHDRDTLYTWANAVTHAATLNAMTFADHADWRVPNVRELMSILDYDTTNPALLASAFHNGCVGGCNGVSCSCTRIGGYWSSSTVTSLPTAAWWVNFFDGSVLTLSKTAMGGGSVRAVRGGS